MLAMSSDLQSVSVVFSWIVFYQLGIAQELHHRHFEFARSQEARFKKLTNKLIDLQGHIRYFSC